jgi:glycerophosphoryl diester phosphodiesterase
VWTVNTDDELELCRALGVEAVITDRPAYMVGKLRG